MMAFTLEGGPRLAEIGLITSASPTGPCSDFTTSLRPACEIEKVELWQGRVSGTQRYVPLRFGIVASTAATGAATITVPSVTGRDQAPYATVSFCDAVVCRRQIRKSHTIQCQCVDCYG